jgi:hypothetical protein
MGYDPNLGVFIERDPEGYAAGDENLYRVVGNSPTNATDPTGEFAVAPNLLSARYLVPPMLGPARLRAYLEYGFNEASIGRRFVQAVDGWLNFRDEAGHVIFVDHFHAMDLKAVVQDVAGGPNAAPAAATDLINIARPWQFKFWAAPLICTADLTVRARWGLFGPGAGVARVRLNGSSSLVDYTADIAAHPGGSGQVIGWAQELAADQAGRLVPVGGRENAPGVGGYIEEVATQNWTQNGVLPSPAGGWNFISHLARSAGNGNRVSWDSELSFLSGTPGATEAKGTVSL